MIRFIEIGDQIKLQANYKKAPATDFAFYNPVIDRFLIIGDTEVFDSVEDFIECFNYYKGYSLEMLLEIIPDKYFTNYPRDYYVK
jgi:hypothetical protein